MVQNLGPSAWPPVTNLHYPSPTFTNLHHPSPTFTNHYQSTPIYTTRHQPLPTFTNLHQPLPTFTNLHHPSPTFTDLHQFTPTFTNFHQFTPPVTNLHQPSPTITNLHQFSSTFTNLYRPSPIYTNLYQLSPIYTNFHFTIYKFYPPGMLKKVRKKHMSAQQMWSLFGIALVVLVAMDLPWVLLNTRYGAYKGRVDGAITHPLAIGSLWFTVLLSEAFLLSYIVSRATSWWTALLSGLFVGFVVYFTFNGTSLVTFRQWPWWLAVVDTLWGMILLGTAATVSYVAVMGHRPTLDTTTHHPAALAV
jgi:uncharacterized membrane protein